MEQTTVQRARGGDERAFAALTGPYRRELQVHCYRLLGSLTDAEDMVQETLLAAWRGLGEFQERASLRTWLYRIATNRCLNALRSAGRRIPAEPVPPFQPPEPSRRGELTWLQPYPDSLLAGIADPAPGPEARYQATEAVELAFVAGLQVMPPRQAAALVLRDVVGFATEEVAGMLGTSHTAVKGALQRAHAALERDRAGRAPRPGSATEHDLARRFADAFVAADVGRVVALLTDDAWLSMPPAPHEYQGAAAIGAFLRVASPTAATAGCTCCPPAPTPSPPSAATWPTAPTEPPPRWACWCSPWPVTASTPSPTSTSTPSTPASGSPSRCLHPWGRPPGASAAEAPSIPTVDCELHRPLACRSVRAAAAT